MNKVNCIGFDPAYAKPVAVAFREDWTKGAPWYTTSTHAKAGDVREFMSDINSFMLGFSYVVCENVYMGRNPAVMAGLARVQGNIEAIAILAGLEFVLVNTSTWAKVLPDKIGGGRRTKRKDIIAGAILFARELTGRDDLSEDESVAVCIAHWGNENLQAEESE